MNELSQLSRRERQIMEIIYQRGEATVTAVLENLADAPARVSVRTLVRILEEKGQLRHVKKGREFVYQPTQQRERAGKSAFQRVLATFFEGSLERAVAAHLTDPEAEISAAELKRLSALISEAKCKEDL
jgi:predicted transcriptional regulator